MVLGNVNNENTGNLESAILPASGTPAGVSSHLKPLSQKDPDARRQALALVLEAEGLAYTLQEEEPGFKHPRGIVNYLLTPWKEQPGLLFCAHYDAVPGSFGANDNAAALCILIALAKELKARELPARFAFFDGEENGNAGSRLYVSRMEKESLTGAINLDVCGFGDTIGICGRGHENKPPLRPFCTRGILQKHNAQVLKYLPKSDEASFRGSSIPAMSLCVVPLWDIQYLKALASYGDGFIGRPPEFNMIFEQMEVTTTFHGGYRDHPRYVEPKAMEQVLSYLLDGITASPAPKTRFWKFSPVP